MMKMMETNKHLERQHVFVADNYLVANNEKYNIFGIVSAFGTSSSIDYTAGKFETLLGETLFTWESFVEWIGVTENEDKLVDMLMSLHDDKNRCSLSCYLSDQTYSLFIFCLRTFLPDLDLQDSSVLQEIDSLYRHIDKDILVLSRKQINSAQVEGIYSYLCKVADSSRCRILSEMLAKVAYNESNLVRSIEVLLMTDKSMMDYLNYFPQFLKIVKDQGEKVVVHSFEHGFDILKLCKNGLFKKAYKSNMEYALEKIVDIRKDKQVRFLSNMVIMFHYVWNKFLDTENIGDLSYLDKVFILVIWLLFQSQHSGWMISTEDFGKLKVLLADLKENT